MTPRAPIVPCVTSKDAIHNSVTLSFPRHCAAVATCPLHIHDSSLFQAPKIKSALGANSGKRHWKAFRLVDNRCALVSELLALPCCTIKPTTITEAGACRKSVGNSCTVSVRVFYTVGREHKEKTSAGGAKIDVGTVRGKVEPALKHVGLKPQCLVCICGTVQLQLSIICV